MDKNMLPEVGDTVRIKSDNPEYDKKRGKVILIREYDHPKLALVELPDGTQRYFKMQRLNVVKVE